MTKMQKNTSLEYTCNCPELAAVQVTALENHFKRACT